MKKEAEIRAERRFKAIDNLNQQVLRLIDGLFLPIENPTQEAFDALWEATVGSLYELADGKENDFLIVCRQASVALKKLIKEKQWNIYFEIRVNTIHKEPVLRNSDWLESGFTLLNLHRQWITHIRVNGLPNNPKDAFTAFFISLMMHSGICHKRYLWLVAKDLLVGELQVRLFNGLPYIRIFFQPERGHFTNDYSEEDEKIFTRHVFLSPISLHLLNHFYTLRTVDCDIFEDKKAHMVGLQRLLSKYLQTIAKSLYAESEAVGVAFSFPNAEKLQQARGDNFSHAIKQLYLHQSVIKSAIFVTENTGTLLPQPLVHYAMGALQSACLPEVFYENRSFSTGSNRSFNDFASVSVPKDLTTTKVSNHSHFYQILRKALVNHSPQQKTSPTRLREELIKVCEQAKSQSELWLVEWYLFLLDDKNKPSTLKQYHYHVSRSWLTATQGEDLLNYTAEDFEDIYQRIDENTEKNNDYKLQRLIQLHKFLVRRYRVPKINEDIREDTKAGQHIRSGLVSEPLFSALLTAIQQMAYANTQTKHLIQAMCIICYRCGLRISEAVKLTYRDLVTSENGHWIYIRTNRYRNNKTYSSYRKLPLSAMLLPEEQKIIELFTLRLGSPDACVFSLDYRPIDEALIAKIASYYLRTISGNDRIVLHHFRHSCMSRLQLMSLGESKEILPNLVPYDKVQVDNILSLIVADNEYTEYALAKFAGHGDPEVTYKHYYHFTSYALGKAVVNSEMPIDKALANCLLGVGRRRFKKLSQDDKHIYAKDALPLIIKQCEHLVQPKLTKQPQVTRKVVDDIAEPTLKQKYDMGIVNELLEKLVNGAHDLPQLIALYGWEEVFEQWLMNAEAIKSRYLTPQGKSRLFSSKRAHHLVPAPLVWQEDIIYCAKVQRKIRPLWEKLSEAEKTEFFKAIDYTLSNASASKSGVRFTDPKTLKHYLKTLSLLFPQTHWQAELSGVTGGTQEKQWRKALKKIHCIEKSQATKTGRSGKGEVRLKIIPLSKDNFTASNSQKRSSNILVYFFHMMAIMMWQSIVLRLKLDI